jgi:hypothetical protein
MKRYAEFLGTATDTSIMCERNLPDYAVYARRVPGQTASSHTSLSEYLCTA